jgi:cytochrome P450
MSVLDSLRGGSDLPPGPAMPTPVQAVGWALRPLGFMDKCQQRFGETFTLRVRRGRPWVFLTNPDHVKQVFTTDSALMGAGAGEANPLLEPLLGSRSVMLLDEPQHMNDRRNLLPSFHGRMMQGYSDMMSEVARREIATWPLGEPFELWPRMQAISLEVVMRAVFGGAEGEQMELLRTRLVEMTNWINTPRRLMMLAAVGAKSITTNSEFRAVMEPVETLVLQEVRRRRASGENEGREDILAMLDRSYNGEDAMDDVKMRDELVTMLSDGPTATSLAWAFERLLRHPEKLARLREEALGEDGEEYAEAVVKETLRLCPAVPVVMRRLVQPMRLDGYTLPAGTIVAPCVFLMHRRGDVYPEPRSFRPERFLERGAGTYTWIPFGGGPRRCVAASFAQLEMKRVIQTILREVELSAAETRSEAAARSSVSFVPDGGAKVIALRRPRPAAVAA